MFYVKEISKNKYLEISSCCDYPHNYFDLEISWNKKQDHAGFNFMLNILKFSFEFNIVDTRHWDYDNDCWEEYPELKKDEWEDQMGIGV